MRELCFHCNGELDIFRNWWESSHSIVCSCCNRKWTSKEVYLLEKERVTKQRKPLEERVRRVIARHVDKGT